MIKKNLQLKFLKGLQDFLFRNSLFNDILKIKLIWVNSWVSHPRELTGKLSDSNMVWFKSQEINETAKPQLTETYD